MDKGKRYKIIMIAKGIRVEDTNHFISSFVRSQADSIEKHVELICFALDDTRSPIGILKNALKLRHKIRNIHPDIVHAQYGSTTALIGLLAAYRKCPLVISLGGGDVIEDPTARTIVQVLRSKLVIGVGRFCFQYAKGLIVKSSNLYAALPVSAKPIASILPNGVDITKFRLTPKAEVGRVLKLDFESKIVLFNRSQGSNREYKCIELAQSAISILKKKVSNVVFLATSNEPHERMPLYFNVADLLLVTSISEGSPNVVKEAMACNLPIVTVECGDVNERLKNVVPSRIVCRDPKALADAMESILISNQRSNGRQEIIKQGLDIESTRHALIKIYEGALTRERTNHED